MPDLHPHQVTDDLTVSIYNHDLSVFAAPGVLVVTASDGFKNDAVSVHPPLDLARQHVRHMQHMIGEAERLEWEAGRAVIVSVGDVIHIDIPAPESVVVPFRMIRIEGRV